MQWGVGWIVVDKPAGISVHNLPGGDLCTLLKGYFQKNTSACRRIQMDTAFGVHAVHRLDKETSGLVLLAVQREVFRFLSEQFSSGRVIKGYQAVVHGRLPVAADPDGWCWWDWPLTGAAAGRRNPGGSGRRLDAKTLFRVIRRSERYSVIQCQPVTGRTHQIRRHAALAGHGIVGDRRYGSKRAARHLAQYLNFSRLALHAVELSFKPSATEESICIQSGGGGVHPELDQLIKRGGEDVH